MGGIGSGRHTGWGRSTVEQHLRLKIPYLQSRGLLNDKSQEDCVWRKGQTVLGRIRVAGGHDRLVISVLDGGGGVVGQSREVRLARRPLPFGGARSYFLCPGITPGSPCDRRVLHLYLAGDQVVCRHCVQLPYASQREPELVRAVRRGDRIRARLGGQTGWALPFPERPKGMWRRTYDRALAEWVEQEFRLDDALDELRERVRRIDQKLADRTSPGTTVALRC